MPRLKGADLMTVCAERHCSMHESKPPPGLGTDKGRLNGEMLQLGGLSTSRQMSADSSKLLESGSLMAAMWKGSGKERHLRFEHRVQAIKARPSPDPWPDDCGS
jgi:hypothetical protein